ncbi:crotonyl-CoA reductase [Streptomyces scabiei]|uniref:Crotonyl-CoA reductase n=1 Tax=Streptomyces scabiei TaxID=1930 RepID=A0A124C5P2_STRSC|nr:crotonyl-CoA reductase [Streptomyces scabiei]
MHRNLHQGKVGVLALAPEEGLGVRDHAKRARHIDAINRFRETAAASRPEEGKPRS